jgi:hypothetical protein
MVGIQMSHAAPAHNAAANAVRMLYRPAPRKYPNPGKCFSTTNGHPVAISNPMSPTPIQIVIDRLHGHSRRASPYNPAPSINNKGTMPK